MRGIVKDIGITTIGGVVPANDKLMDIVPLDDQLLVEPRGALALGGTIQQVLN